MSSKITLRNPEELARETAQWRHVFGKDGRILCDTEHRGHRTPKNLAPLDLTDIDKGDLRRLYAAAWSGALSNINGAPIRFVKPYHLSGVPAESMMTVQHVHAATLPRAAVGYPNGA